jgi:hypothetical protein
MNPHRVQLNLYRVQLNLVCVQMNPYRVQLNLVRVQLNLIRVQLNLIHGLNSMRLGTTVTAARVIGTGSAPAGFFDRQATVAGVASKAGGGSSTTVSDCTRIGGKGDFHEEEKETKQRT